MVALMGVRQQIVRKEHKEEVARGQVCKAKRRTRNVNSAMIGMARGPAGAPTPNQGRVALVPRLM
jgi:hypothetical protein